MQIKNIDFSRAAIINSWKNDPFYGEEAVVLGLDIGIEGIGIAVRKGKELVYCKSLLVELPKSKPLAGRRILRGGRRARKNRRLRMRRLKNLFEEHGLPWVDDEVMSRSDPFPMRYRAAYKGGLASKEALSICIRSLVAHRGYDFYALSIDEGSYPWGTEPQLDDACKWLSSTFLDDGGAEKLRSYTDELFSKDTPLNDNQIEKWEQAIAEQLKWSRERSMEKILEEYYTKKKRDRTAHRRGRGFNFPRAQVEDHLKAIIEKHAALIREPIEFKRKLFLPCTTKEQKAASIFHYNRKTPDECKKHFLKKVGKCPFSLQWGLEKKQCALRSDPDVRKWNLIDFLSNRRFILLEGKQQVSRTLPESCVKTLIDYLVAHTTSKTKPSWDKAKKALEAVLKAENLKIAPQEKVKIISPWDKLKERIAPGRSSKQSSPEYLRDFLSHQNFPLEENGQITEKNLSENCVKTLIEYLAAHPIPDTKPSWREAKKALEAALKTEGLKIAPRQGPKKKSSVWDQLKDLIAPSRSLNNRGKLSSEAARQLFNDATLEGTSFDPKKISDRKKEIGYYEILANTLMDYGVYTQVQTLLGVLRKPKEGKTISSPFGVKGFLHQLFEKELADKLGGKLVPDYCIIECIKDPPRNEEEKKKRAEAGSDSRAFAENLAKMYGLSQVPGRSVLTRLKLYRQQGGVAKDGLIKTQAVCPFTGRLLGPNPLSADLELAHLFPDSRGGLAIEDNLVLTHRKTNGDMHNLTPREAARLGLDNWLSWEEIEKLRRGFKWSDKKRELFSFVPTKKQPVPDFENLTRTAQLARQLRRMVCLWMELMEDSVEVRKRIGNPSGLHTAAARRGWKVGKKDRSDKSHHRVDAAILSFIPPAAGLNNVLCGGIFENLPSEVVIGGNKTKVYRIEAVAELKPDLSALEEETRQECPVISLRSRSKSKSLGDSTFWRVDSEGNLWQREPLLPAMKKDDLEKLTVEKLREILLGRKIPESEIPSDEKLEKWMQNLEKPLLLKGRKRPIRFIEKKSGKGTFKSPVGWSGIIHPDGTVAQLRKLDETNERLELWLGWNGRRWEYYKRIIPSKEAMRGLKRLGLPWRGREGLLPHMIKFLDAKGVADFREYYCEKLPPFAHKVGEFKKGDTFLLSPEEGEKAKEGVDTTMFASEESILPQSKWYQVSAINSRKSIELKPIFQEGKTYERVAGLVLAGLLRLGSAEEEARKLNLRAPSVGGP